MDFHTSLDGWLDDKLEWSQATTERYKEDVVPRFFFLSSRNSFFFILFFWNNPLQRCSQAGTDHVNNNRRLSVDTPTLETTSREVICCQKDRHGVSAKEPNTTRAVVSWRVREWEAS